MAATGKNLSGSGVLYTDRRDFYISPQVVKELWTDVTPFTTVVANQEKITPADPTFKMFELWDSTKTTLRGHALITEASSSSTLKFKNIGADALDATDNDVFIVVGNAHGEGTEAPEAWSDELKVVYNTTQIFNLTGDQNQCHFSQLTIFNLKGNLDFQFIFAI